MLKKLLTISAMAVAFGVAACDDGQEQAEQPNSPRPDATTTPQQGMTPPSSTPAERPATPPAQQ